MCKKSRVSKKSFQTLQSPMEMSFYFPYISEFVCQRAQWVKWQWSNMGQNHRPGNPGMFLTKANFFKYVYLQHKPFFGMKPLSEADKRRASNQSIPSLAELLELAKNEKKFVIFDLFGPPPKHPFRNTFVRRVVKVILDSNIEQRLVRLSPRSWSGLGGGQPVQEHSS